MLVLSENQCLGTCSLVTNRRPKRDRAHFEKAQMKVLTFDKLTDLTINQLTCESVPSFICSELIHKSDEAKNCPVPRR